MSKTLSTVKQIEQKEFSVHPAIIYSIISKQASGIPKALLELAMNSVDAGATELNIVLTESNFVFSDNGKGFKDIDEVESFFGTFGTPHAEGDAYYGRYRLGRGQIMCYAKTQWFTKDICMNVDLNIDPHAMGQDAPLGYKITTAHDFHQGCKIVGDFYKTQKVGCVDKPNLDQDSAPEYIKEIIPAFIKMIKYLPISVFINGTKVNKDVDSVPFIESNDEAVFALSQIFNPDNVRSGKNAIVNVYNKGVYAYQIRSTYFTGDVISKESIDLNMARNQAKTTCKIATGITRKISQLDQKVSLKNVKKSRKQENTINIEISNFVEDLWKGILGFKPVSASELYEAVNEKVFTLASDKRVSLRDIVKQLKKFYESATESCVPLNLFYYNDEIIEAVLGQYRDSMTISRGYIPLSIFPSHDLIRSLTFSIELPSSVYEEKLDRLYKLYTGNRHNNVAVSTWFERSIHEFKTQVSSIKFDLEHLEGKPDIHFNKLMHYLCSVVEIVVDLNAVNYYSLNNVSTDYAVNMGEKHNYRTSELPLIFKSPIRSIEYVDIEVLKSQPILKNAKLNGFEKSVLKAIEYAFSDFKIIKTSRTVYSVIGDELESANQSNNKKCYSREFRVISNSDEPHVLAWTDGANFVAFNEEYFKMCIKNSDYESLINVALHEICHLNDSKNANTHGATFYFAHKTVFSKVFESTVRYFYTNLTLAMLRKKDNVLACGITLEQLAFLMKREINSYVAQAS